MSKPESSLPRRRQWAAPLFTGCLCTDFLNCLYGTFFPGCAIASAKSLFDGSDWCFNFICFAHNPAMVRNYIRRGYGISGRVGISDCFTTLVCFQCSAVQLLNEVSIRGPAIVSVESVAESDWLAAEAEYSCIHDPCDFLMTSACCCCETSNLYSQLSGVPLWFTLCPCNYNPVNICQARHLIRKSYGIGGNDCYEDCLRPCCLLPCPVIGQVYLYKSMASMRAEIALRGTPENYMVTQTAATSTDGGARGKRK